MKLNKIHIKHIISYHLYVCMCYSNEVVRAIWWGWHRR